MLIPPEADPVTPARMLTATASEIKGLSPPRSKTTSRSIAKAGNAATTAPKPTSDAVLKIGRTEALAPASSDVRKDARRVQFRATSTRMAVQSARMIDHSPSTFGRPTAP